MSGLTTDATVTWVAALASLVVLGGMFGERRLFGISQHLLAGLATGYLAVLVIREVLAPRIVQPLLADPTGRPELWVALVAAGAAAAAPWLPRRIAAVPMGVLVGGIGAFALGGALVGTVLPQASAAVARQGDAATVTSGLASLVVTALVLVAFVRGRAAGRLLAVGASAGRWLIVAGAGSWLGYLLFTRLILLIDRTRFLMTDWLGIGR